MNKPEGFLPNNEVVLSEPSALKKRIYVELIDSPSFLKYWEETGLPFKKIAKRNFEQMQRLEEKQPGICKALNEEFNIYNFYKFPETVLLRQYDFLNKAGVPYGIVLAAVRDISSSEPKSDNHKDGFNNYQWQNLLQDISQQLGSDAVLRIFECGNIQDVKRALKLCVEKYSKTSKCDFAIISGHSSSEEIQLGEDNGNKENSLSFDNSSFLSGFKNTFSENAVVILDACSAVAKGNSVGGSIAEYLNLRVVGIEDEGSLRSVRVLKRKNKLEVTKANFSFSKKIKEIHPI